jgi:hypothetical protein
MMTAFICIALAALLIYFNTALKEDHIILKTLNLVWVVMLIFLAAKSGVDSNTICTAGVDSIDVNGTYTYTKVCIENEFSTANSLYQTILLLTYRILPIYIGIFVIWKFHKWLYERLMLPILRFMGGFKR